MNLKSSTSVRNAILIGFIGLVIIASSTLSLKSIFSNGSPIAKAAGGLTFSEFAVHPNASNSGYAPGTFGCTSQTLCRVGQTLTDMNVTTNGNLVAGYGDWNANIDGKTPADGLGRVGVRPLNLTTGQWGSMFYSGSEALDVVRKSKDGHLYIPNTDSSFHPPTGETGRDISGYVTNDTDLDGNPATDDWRFVRDIGTDLHTFDVAVLNDGTIVSVGRGNTPAAATMRYSKDGGATWQLAGQGLGNDSFERFYWAANLGSKVYVKNATTGTKHSFDGTTWASAPSLPECNTYNAKLIETFDGYTVCADGYILRAFDGTNSKSINISGAIRDLYVDNGYLYALTSSGIYRTNSLAGSVAWEQIAESLLLPTLQTIAVYNDYVYLGGEFGKIWRSEQAIASSPAVVHTDESCFFFKPSTGTISGYYNHQGDNPANPVCPRSVEIPSRIAGVEVKEIAYWSFASKGLKSVVIPESVTSIGSNAFQSNRLERLIIPETINSIGANAFGNNRLSEVTIVGNPITLGDNIFISNPISSISYNGNTYHATESSPDECLFFSSGVVSGYRYADVNLVKNQGTLCLDRDIVIPSTIGGVQVTSIGSGAFNNSNFTSIVIPDTVQSIADNSMRNSPSLTSLTIQGNPATIGNLTTYGSPISYLSYNGVEYTSDSPTPDSCFTFLSGAIRNYADSIDFNRVKSSGSACLRSVVIPATINGQPVKSISDLAFGSKSLSSVVIPDSVETIGNFAFQYNYIDSVHLGDSISTIGNGAFGFNKITSVDMPNSVTTISPMTFAAQSRLGADINNNTHGYRSVYPWIAQKAYDEIWYTRLYTADTSNPKGLSDGIMSEHQILSGLDGNGNGTTADSFGGHLINPVRLTVNAVDRNGSAIPGHAPTESVGVSSSTGQPLTDYFAKAGGAFAPLNPTNPTPAEGVTMSAGFAQYYHLGDVVSAPAPDDTPGYTRVYSPLTTNVELNQLNNSVNFVYVPTITNVDFATNPGTITNPTPGSVPDGLPHLISDSALSTDTNKGCHIIREAKLLTGSGLIHSVDSYKTVGGFDFTLDCLSPGQDAIVSMTLGKTIPDAELGQVWVVKQTADGEVIDITIQTTIANNNGQTVISYSLTDGGELDDDGVVNGAIVDPVYILLPDEQVGELAPDSISESVEEASMDNGDLADTGASAVVVTVVAIVTILGGAIIARRGWK